PAVFNLPADIVIEATGPSGAEAFYGNPFATDTVDGSVLVLCVPPGGSFPVGVTIVVCTATDTHGNSAAPTFTVTVTDTTPPVIGNVPATITTEATGPGGAV